MKKLILFLLAGYLYNVVQSQTLSCSIVKQVPIAVKAEIAAASGAADTICINQTTTFCTDAVAGALYSWSVIGTGIQIVGSTTGNCVTVSATATGTYKICLSKSGNGFEPCCNCKTVIVTTCGGGGGGVCPPCTLKIVTDKTNTDNGPWDYSCPNNCIYNRLKLDVICDGDPAALKNWMSANGITGTVRWEITNGNIQFTTPLQPCLTDACGTRCDTRNIAFPTYLVSSYICACSNLPFWENFTAKATINFVKNGVTCTRVIYGVIHLYDEATGCPSGKLSAAGNVTNIKIIPNPAAAHAAVKFDVKQEDSYIVSVYDIAGNKAMDISQNEKLTPGTKTIQFNLKGLHQKQYFILIKNSRGIVVAKEKMMVE